MFVSLIKTVKKVIGMENIESHAYILPLTINSYFFTYTFLPPMIYIPEVRASSFFIPFIS